LPIYKRKHHIRHCILCEFQRGISASKARKSLCSVLETCDYRYERFRSGDLDLSETCLPLLTRRQQAVIDKYTLHGNPKRKNVVGKPQTTQYIDGETRHPLEEDGSPVYLVVGHKGCTSLRTHGNWSSHDDCGTLQSITEQTERRT
uniref:HTH_48 domain-containing protein n=1 Tax=Mesocestoides corti TaxID=53468 RepID=A0A158QUX6_MESCO